MRTIIDHQSRSQATSRRNRSRATFALFASSLLLAACSIGVEESPRTWSSWDRFDEPPQVSSSGVERIYLIDNELEGADSRRVLTTTKRDIAQGINAYRAILDVLFKGPTSEEAVEGLKSSIPAGLKVIGDPQIDQDTVFVDVSPELTTLLRDSLIDALAQIVWTLCERPETKQVRILVEGRQVPWPRADGTLVDRPLTPFDYPGFAVSSQPDFPGVIEVRLSS